MVFLDRVLDAPSYGFTRDGKFYRPTQREILSEFFAHMNIFKSRKNWLPLFSWVTSLSFAIPLVYFLTHHFSWPYAVIGFVYSMVILGSHGTFWLHRYCAHRAYRFRNSFIREVCRNAVIKVIPEEAYAVSHYVHHHLSEKPGDPYNVYGGWLYCFVADVVHQRINPDLSPKDYEKLCQLMNHSGVKLNSYAQYKKWGTLAHPVRTVAHFALNWAFWFAVFYAVGGMALATCIFGFTGVWAIGIRTFNFDGHGKGKDMRRDGIDFCRTDISINQNWPGYVAGEWHNNHHLYPNGARSGFLPYQLDLPWLAIRGLYVVGGVVSYRDFKEEFMTKHYLPYVASHKSVA